MIIEPKIRGFICTTAHPVGCAKYLADQIQIIKEKGVFDGPKHVLVIGASTGYGLASRLVATFGCHAKTIGVSFEKPADEKRTASPGWYQTAAFEQAAHRAGYYAKSINGDAFSKEIKAQTIALIKQDLKTVDLVIYSIASPRRTDPVTQETYSSVLKPIGAPYMGKTVDAFRGEIKPVTIPPATESEIEATVRVMGGDDWALWMDALLEAGVLASGVKTVAYSYIGPVLTHAIYKNGTIGRAKDHLKATALALNTRLKDKQGSALIAVNKALVTQASAAIPVVPLYIALLFKLMKEAGTHEDCLLQMYRLFHDHLYPKNQHAHAVDKDIRLDDLEMDERIQAEIARLWPEITSENVYALTDLKGYCDDFYRLFGFHIPGVDYALSVDPFVPIESIKT